MVAADFMAGARSEQGLPHPPACAAGDLPPPRQGTPKLLRRRL